MFEGKYKKYKKKYNMFKNKNNVISVQNPWFNYIKMK